MNIFLYVLCDDTTGYKIEGIFKFANINRRDLSSAIYYDRA